MDPSADIRIVEESATNASPVANPGAMVVPPAGMAVDTVRRLLLRLALALGLVNVLLPIGLVLYAEAVGEVYWWMFWGEGNAITWFSSVQLLIVGVVAYLNYELLGLLGRLGRDGARGNAWIWLVFAAGFIFLALDERFEFHETLREGVLQPLGLFSDMAYVESGYIGLYLYLTVGLVFAAFLFPELRPWRGSLGFFIAALVLSAAFTIVDALPEEDVAYFLTSFFEESGEIWAQFLFLLSFLAVLNGRLERLRPPVVEPT